ncbi:streptomycin biosynthesis protein [Streptomyces sp. NPDC021212]|uniref:streptomycin biosynthesis protein n=1 Tax=Streptomyces sp. NPDC021212 TaxID=3365118 RepID=UPI0037B194C7
MRELAESGGPLPPILVHRSTSQVIDGMHRLHAAALRGDPTIAVVYFDGDEFECFIQSVRVNLAHGLPLSAGDREQAVKKILKARPHWSDRAIAEVAGISPPTVAGIRSRSTASTWQLSERVGRDGRVRPTDGGQGRRRAAEIILACPTASLREVARQAGVAVGTAHNVRVRLREEGHPVPGRRDEPQRQPNRNADPLAADRIPHASPQTGARGSGQVLLSLRKDPSLRLSSTGRFLLQWLGVLAVEPEQLEKFARSVPRHWVKATAALARECSDRWARLGEALERRTDAV